MIKKDDAERTLRFLCHEWETAKGKRFGPNDHSSFSEFTSWLDQKGYSHYLYYRSQMGAPHDAEYGSMKNSS